MPIYEYRCLKCGHQFEKIQKISDTAASKCEKCGNRVTRVFNPIAIRFKGSGFYTTDYGKGGAARNKKGEQKEGKSGRDEGGKPKKDKGGKPKSKSSAKKSGS
ncbi:MAG: FmdB family zinc ribbon protein [Thermoleophilia bacterium]